MKAKLEPINTRIGFFLLCILTGLNGDLLKAQENRWTGAAGGKWEDGTKWHLGIPPNINHNVVIANGGSESCSEITTGTSPHAVDTFKQMDTLLRAQNKLADLETLWRDEVELRKQHFGKVNRQVEAALASLAEVLQEQRKSPEAEVVLREKLAMEQELSEFDKAQAEKQATPP